ncbi:MAG: hypothetical protein ABGX83_05225 [Nitrospira sp.]
MSKDDRILAIWTAVIIASVIILVTCSVTNMAGARELPVLVEVSDLGEEYDNQRVTVMGWARSAEAMRGRMGSNYVRATVGEGESEVTVFSDFPHYNIVNNRVIVQGVYHREGRFGGLLADHFIVADALIRDWERK